MARVVTVSLNTALDKTYVVDRFKLGHVNQVQRAWTDAGGKGVNVARVVHLLGGDPLIVGFVAGGHGAIIRKRLDDTRLHHRIVEVDGESRTCVTLVDPSRRSFTDILEPGPTVKAEDLDRLQEILVQEAVGAEFVVFSGSLPPGVPTSVYRDWIRLVRAENGPSRPRIVLDTSGKALQEGIEARPDLIKPNLEELEGLTGTPLGPREVVVQAKELVERGVGTVLISLGADGAVCANGERVIRLSVLPIQVMNPVGCGDALVGGTLVGLCRGMAMPDATRLGIAAATSNALHLPAGLCDPEQVETFFHQIEWVETEYPR